VLTTDGDTTTFLDFNGSTSAGKVAGKLLLRGVDNSNPVDVNLQVGAGTNASDGHVYGTTTYDGMLAVAMAAMNFEYGADSNPITNASPSGLTMDVPNGETLVGTSGKYDLSYAWGHEAVPDSGTAKGYDFSSGTCYAGLAFFRGTSAPARINRNIGGGLGVLEVTGYAGSLPDLNVIGGTGVLEVTGYAGSTTAVAPSISYVDATISFVHSGSNTTPLSTGADPLTGLQAGDLMVAFVVASGEVGVSPAPGWHYIGGEAYGGSLGLLVHAYWKEYADGDQAAFVANLVYQGISYRAMAAVAAFRDTNVTDPISKFVVDSTTLSGVPDPRTQGVAWAASTQFDYDAGGTVTFDPPAGFTERGDNGYNSTQGDNIAAAVAVQDTQGNTSVYAGFSRSRVATYESEIVLAIKPSDVP